MNNGGLTLTSSHQSSKPRWESRLSHTFLSDAMQKALPRYSI